MRHIKTLTPCGPSLGVQIGGGSLDRTPRKLLAQSGALDVLHVTADSPWIDPSGPIALTLQRGLSIIRRARHMWERALRDKLPIRESAQHIPVARTTLNEGLRQDALAPKLKTP